MLAALVIAAPASFAQDSHDHDHEHGPGPGKGANEVATDPHAGHDHAEEADAHEGHGDEVTFSDAALQRAGIELGAATMRSLQSSFVAPARVAFNAQAMAHVGSVVSGRVADIQVGLGDRVKQGDVLLVVESPEFGRSQSEFLQRQVEAEVAAAAVAPAKDAAERARKLFEESQGIALAEVRTREADHRAAVGMEAVSRGQLEAAKNELRLLGLTPQDIQTLGESREVTPRMTIRAPIDGRVVERDVTLGELVSPDQGRLLVIADTADLWVLADVPEGRLDSVGVGSEAEIHAASLPGGSVTGEVSLVSAEIDPHTRTARARIVIDNPEDRLKPGMFARVALAAARSPDAVLAIPEEAVQTVEGEPSVFVPVEGEPNTFARRDVVVGPPVNGFVPVISGLGDGDKLVVGGSFILKAELGKGSAEHVH